MERELTRLSMIAEGDRVAYHAVGTATTIDGKPYNNQFLYILQFRDGKVCRLIELIRFLSTNCAPPGTKSGQRESRSA